MAGESSWRGRGATLEAMVALSIARLLIAWVPFGRWRRWLGAPAAPENPDPQLRLDANLARRRLARAVERGAGRLPGQSRCLARAVALQWMLRRRGLGGVIHLGVRPEGKRGGLDDLHAWVSRSGEVLIGASDEPHSSLYAAANRDSVS
jgi:hypothetical protein